MYIVNVLLLATPLAVFEIWLDVSGKKIGPWGDTKFVDPFWGKELKVPYFSQMFSHLTRYHIVLFGYIGLVVFVLEYMVLRLLSDSGWIIMYIHGVKIIAPLYIAAVLVGNMLAEDMLWFVIQSITGKLFGWGEPEAVARLLRGDFKWHTKWSQITTSVMLPRSYLTTPGWVVILLIAQGGFRLTTYICISVVLLIQQVLYSLKVEKK